MKNVVVRYKLKVERVREHEELIRAVFSELAKTAPAGLRYGAFKQPDGVTYVHFATLPAGKNPLDRLRSFKAFTARIGDRCETPPEVVELEAVGTHAYE
jgi:hypothetical protein